ncbi:MAG: BBE domain-containing protein [Rhodopila sp.]
MVDKRVSEWLNREQNSACVSWARESYAAVQPFIGNTRYVNYLDGDEGDDAVAAAYGLNYRRLQAIKSRYDPDNTFHMNQNIRPLA